MERSVSCTAERGPAAAVNDLRCYSASYATSLPAPKHPIKRAKSTSSWSTPAAAAGVPRTTSSKGPSLNLRSYSASYSASYAPHLDGVQVKRTTSGGGAWASSGRGINLRGYTPSFAAVLDVQPAAAERSGGDSGEMQRRRRLAEYKVYDVEGRVKESLRRSVKWIKGKYSRAVYGWW